MVERLLQRAVYDDQLQEYFALVSKTAAIESQETSDELANSPIYRDLLEQIATVQEQLDATLADFDDSGSREFLRDLDTPP